MTDPQLTSLDAEDQRSIAIALWCLSSIDTSKYDWHSIEDHLSTASAALSTLLAKYVTSWTTLVPKERK